MTAEAAEKKTGTTYLVFQEVDLQDGKNYRRVGGSDARSADEAIKAVADKAGVYVAIPARSFKPVKVTVHTETTIRLG